MNRTQTVLLALLLGLCWRTAKAQSSFDWRGAVWQFAIADPGCSPRPYIPSCGTVTYRVVSDTLLGGYPAYWLNGFGLRDESGEVFVWFQGRWRKLYDFNVQDANWFWLHWPMGGGRGTPSFSEDSIRLQIFHVRDSVVGV